MVTIENPHGDRDDHYPLIVVPRVEKWLHQPLKNFRKSRLTSLTRQSMRIMVHNRAYRA